MVKAWEEKVVIPTYEVGEPEKYPVFLENRVYQGSSGVVYPYQVIESISDVKTDHEWNAIYIENEYIKVMVLPELGGRIQMAYDKVKQRHFVYYNHVIKPALVGLAGPWISGGIEFNWPQHHRPSTYMPVDSAIVNNNDGSVTVWVNETERMFHQRGRAGFTLRPGKAYLEITGIVSNPTDMPQTFLWWANPAVAVNDDYQSVFPPDINAVFDHGKRAVSSFPIATGTYYKMDYSAGVDISNYRNIKVPTSYMGVNSRYDFEGGYENDTQGGMLHVASHHVSPGKKQWTWGNGDFGRAWDRNLTDEDGPYIELMAGVFTENQPDFSWLMPQEEKQFVQYFMPYRDLGIVKNASKELLMNIDPAGEGMARLRVYATSSRQVEIIVTADESGDVIYREPVLISPENVYDKVIPTGDTSLDKLTVKFVFQGRELLSWHAEPDEIKPIPPAAEAALKPEDIKTVEQLYLTATHLEQYRHATFNPVDYYKEALNRDPDDVRCNNALGLWYLRHGRFELAENYLRHAVKVITRRNPNPRDGEPIYNLALCLKYQGKLDEAYAMFYKSTWNAAWQDAGFLECARISTRQGNYDDALYEVDRSLLRNWHNSNARALKAAILTKLGHTDDAITLCRESIAIDTFNYGCRWVEYGLTHDADKLKELKLLLNHNPHNYDEVALDFAKAGLWDLAIALWDEAIADNDVTPMTFYYKGWCQCLKGDNAEALKAFRVAANMSTDGCFPNRLEAILALSSAIECNPEDANALLLLGNLYYDKREYYTACEYWYRASELNPRIAAVWRNLALLNFNKLNNPAEARQDMEKAITLDPESDRLLMEYDQLCRCLGDKPAERLARLQQHQHLVDRRDILILEEATLLNILGQYAEAKHIVDNHKFHPWEGGEGKVPAQYQYARVELAKQAISAGDYNGAIKLLEECLEYPHNLGEGKLYGAQENDFYYLLGLCHKLNGDEKKATECWVKATEGPLEPAAALYYNDAKPDKIFYAGMAWRALGEEAKARSYFNRLLSYGKQHYHDEVEMDYFAVSLPDLLIWDGDLQLSNKQHCRYLMALGYLGLGDTAKGEKLLAEILGNDYCHQGVLATKSFISLCHE